MKKEKVIQKASRHGGVVKRSKPRRREGEARDTAESLGSHQNQEERTRKWDFGQTRAQLCMSLLRVFDIHDRHLGNRIRNKLGHSVLRGEIGSKYG